MREIKFRAWDGEVKMMHMADAIDHWTLKDLRIGTKDKKWKWLLYTGLKDKNGNEIYEGDILEDMYQSIESDIYEVKYDEGKFVAVMNDFIENLSAVAGSSQIMGNIYENPDLFGG